jgi:hypothetical protein
VTLVASTISLISLNALAMFRSFGIRRLVHVGTTGQSSTFVLGIDHGIATLWLEQPGSSRDVAWHFYNWKAGKWQGILEPPNLYAQRLSREAQANGGIAGEFLQIVQWRCCRQFIHIEAVAWPVPIATGIASVLFVRSGWHPRNRPGHCANCGYDLRATPAASLCPECGKVRPAMAGG